jgi:hypothetical protein
MGTMCRVIFVVCIAVMIGSTSGQATTTSKPTIPVLTVCEALNNLSQHNGKVVVVVGKLVGTEEGSWLSEDCNEKIVTDGFTWQNIISLSYSRSEVEPPPRVPKEFNWDLTLLLKKLKQVQRTTRLEVLKQYNYTDKWFAVFGRFETRLPLQVALGGGGKLFGYGFGHLNAAPAQLISVDDGYRELKPK